MTKAKSGIVKTSFKACLEGDVYPRNFSVGEELTGEALKIGNALKMMGGKASKKATADKNAGAAPENKTGFTAPTKTDENAGASTDGGETTGNKDE